MKLLHKKVLIELLKTSYLNDNVYLDDGKILDELHSNKTFDPAESEDIEIQQTPRQKIECMIRILIVKDDAKYESFKKCLEKSYRFVVEKMRRLEIELENR